MLPKHFTPTSGTGGPRTRDLRVASAALSRLSYGPRKHGQGGWTRTSDLARPKRVLSTTELHPDVWWGREGSNLRPPACDTGALPTELHPHANDS